MRRSLCWLAASLAVSIFSLAPLAYGQAISFGGGLPSGGSAGQYLQGPASAPSWVTPSGLMPSGGAAGQYLQGPSSSAAWTTPPPTQKITKLADPSTAPSAVCIGGGSTARLYEIIGVDAAGGKTLPSPVGGPGSGCGGTLNGTSNAINLTWPAIPGAACYDVYAQSPEGKAVALCVSATSLNNIADATIAYTVPGTNTTGGLSVAASATAASFTGPSSGTAALSSGATIGGGQAITASYRGTVTAAVGVVAAGACGQLTITMTGVAAGADCALGVAGSTVPSPLSAYCSTIAGSCLVNICNASAAASASIASATYSCRAFNP